MENRSAYKNVFVQPVAGNAGTAVGADNAQIHFAVAHVETGGVVGDKDSHGAGVLSVLDFHVEGAGTAVDQFPGEDLRRGVAVAGGAGLRAGDGVA